MSHAYHQYYKLVHSGQLRTYYNAGCSCGWRFMDNKGQPRFRVTDEIAVSDWVAHYDNMNINVD